MDGGAVERVTRSSRRSGGPIRVTGTSDDSFGTREWAVAGTVAALWGSSFLWIAIGLESLTPTAVAFGRVLLGGIALWLLPAARRPVDRSAWPRIVAIAIAGNGGPALLFAFAQESIDSSAAGMINSAAPIAILIVGVALTRRRADQRQVAGIAIGFVGVVMIALPSLRGADAEPLGVMFVVVAVFGYGISANLIVELQQQYGSLPIVGRALLVSAVLLAPAGAIGLADSKPTWGAIGAVAVLGVGGTGIARALNASLAGRAGAARGSVTTYLVPVIAITLGATVRDESIQAIEVAGTIVVLAGAWIITRRPARLTRASATSGRRGG